jgi:hypothetical protein
VTEPANPVFPEREKRPLGGRRGCKEMVFFGSLRAYWGKKNLDISFWEAAIPVEPEKRETFWKGKWDPEE